MSYCKVLFLCSILFLSSCVRHDNKSSTSNEAIEQDLSSWKGNYRYDENSVLHIFYEPSTESTPQRLYGSIDNGKTLDPANITISENGEVIIDGIEAKLVNDSIFCIDLASGSSRKIVFPKLTEEQLFEIQNRPYRKNTKGNHEVFVAGVENCKATYWINEDAFNFNNSAKAKNIFVTDSDIYATLQECHGNRAEWYWKNGNTIKVDGDIHSVFVDGDNIYLAGQRNGSAAYWINGTPVTLLPNATAKSIFVNDGNVYVAITDHFHSKAKYWANDTIISLKDGYIANSIFVEDNNIYVAGLGWDESGGNPHVAKYWKNGTEVNLINGYKYEGNSESIFVLGGDVYVAGKIGSVATYWKNGTPVSLTDGQYYAGASSIFIDGTDVYVAGYEVGYGDYVGAKYWKNGEAHALSRDVNSKAFSIVVR